jgi:hypothetical protein
MRLLPAFYMLGLLGSIVCFPLVGALGQDQLALDAQAPIVDPGPKATYAALADHKSFRGFFGYVEFDFDPDAPGGVPGFGPLAQGLPEIAQVKGE